MAIRRSLAGDVGRLIQDLQSGDALRRESAAARLAVIGNRAATQVATVASDISVPADARAAAFRALAAMNAPAALAPALAALDQPDDAVATEAIEVLRTMVHGSTREATRAFDRLTELALSSDAPVERRLAAIAALEGLPNRLMRPVYDMLARDQSSRVVARIVRRQAGLAESLEELVEQGLPDEPDLVAAVVREDGEAARVSVLRRAVDLVRQREADAAGQARPGWLAVRGLLHQALSARGSRAALYDLRDTLAQARAPLPVGFLSAAGAIGDTSCLEPIATAWVRATTLPERWWRDHLAEAFRDIVVRERLTRRHAVLVRILMRWPAAAVLVASAPKRARST